MRVKRLEIQGFKSFKDKTVIHFDHSITGIVGPNGCGKSNIVDAFFWVMGEQSYKHMRGSSSEDLIFNGSSKYSPVGLAEATLVMEVASTVSDLENAPAGASVRDISPVKTKEISVTRRLYRSGEGEYLINGTISRLKDIQELFMDTGVGAKGYSVIEQGQIGKIVNSKPEDRRQLIEEAAGIAKYKARKRESLRKMESTQTNLSRLTDIIQEIEKNLNSLDRQAQKARQYRKYKEELQGKEVTWGRRKSRIIQKKLEGLREQKEALEQDVIGLRAGLQTTENTIEVDRIELLTKTKRSEALQAEIQDLADSLSQEKGSLELSRRRQGDLASQLESLESEKENLSEALQTGTQKLSEMEIQVTEAEHQFENTASESKDLFEALSILRKEVDLARQELETSQKQLKGGMSQISDLTSKTASLSSRAEAAQIQAERVQQQIESQEDKLITLREELERLKIEADDIKGQSYTLQEERKEQSAGVQSEDQEIKLLEKNRDISLRQVTQLRSRLQSLEELDQSHEGFADGPKAALDWAKAHGKKSQIVALTDILRVSDGFETLLQSWLETKIESLVLKNSDFALNLFDEIKKKKQGRIAVQIARETSHKGKHHTDSHSKEVHKLLEKSGFEVLGELTDFVKADEYHHTIDPILAKVYVVESSQPLPEFIASGGLEKLSDWSIVSKDGVALEANGTIRGGSLDTSGAIGILQRKKLIEDLRAQVATAEAAHQALETDLASRKQKIEISRARLQTLQTELQALEVQTAALDRDIHQTDRAYKEAQHHLETLQEEYEEQNSTVHRAQEEKETIQEHLQELIASQTDVEDSIAKAERNLSDKEMVRQEKEEELSSIRVKEASFRERAQSLKRELDATRSLISDRNRRLLEVDRTLERASKEQAEYTGDESSLAQRIEELTLSLAERREKLSLIKDQIEQYNSKVNAALEHIKELHKSGDQKNSLTTQLALEIEKLNSELVHLTQNLEEKYGYGCMNPGIKSVPAVSDKPVSMIVTETENGTEIVVQQEASSEPPAESTETVLGDSSTEELTAEQEIALGEEVERLRERLRRLGEVNVMAIEEFDELKKRYDHLIQEKLDLEQSLKNLESAIEHINKTSEERYRKAFQAIAERFERLFPIVFGGGQAKISLLYPEGSTDILEAGVDILAQPPGKKVVNIGLLSGGEKALTAVSLIFAIFMVKPSPFCVLDEVDAPLDDANIGKFNALLKEMSVKSQFIIITHNKKTMELNDTLYGVTMEEPGVSKMVSIEMH